MPRTSTTVVVLFATGLLCGVGGFVLGRVTVSDEAAIGSRAAAPIENTPGARLAELERERDELRQQLALATSARTEVQPAMPPEHDGMSAPTNAAPAVPIDSNAEILDAAATLAAVRDAIAAGEAAAITALTASARENGEALAPDLVAMLDSADSLFAAEQLANLLGEIGDARALDSLQSLLRRESDDAVRTAAVRALGRIPDESSVALLTAEFTRESGSPMPPSLAATSLGSIGSPAAVAALQKEVTGGSNGMVRSFAMSALAERKDPALVPFFFTQLAREGASERSRKQAIEAIAGTGARGAIPQLEDVAFAGASSRGLQESAKRAINQILGEIRYPVR